MTVEFRSDVPTQPDLERFLQRFVEGLTAQVSGNSGPFLEMWSHGSDVAILGALGSHAQGWEQVQKHLLGASQRLDWTNLSVRRLLTAVSDDLAVTVMLEYMTREEGGEPSARTLRTTQAYRREAGEWRLFLRHANTVTDDDEEHERQLLGNTEEKS
ncbi:MAG TPA: DUF4440 domain-containing protein [Solirubrobacteraceae bacterium]|nr:DUF4440 domain-containing protein [Solirubrobacteraceae bacterium]